MSAMRGFALAAIAAVTVLWLPSAPRAQDGVPAVHYTQVPEIVPYIKKMLIPGLGDAEINVAKTDLSSPPDGVPEYIVMLDNQAFCGSGGCTTEIVRLSSSGDVETLASILRYGFGLAYTSSNGLRDLLSEGKGGKFIWRFDGKEYKPHQGHPKEALTPAQIGDASQSSTPGTAVGDESRPEGPDSRQNLRPKPYVGVAPRSPGCIGEYGWRRGYERMGNIGRGSAVFGHCTDPENMLVKLNCRTDRKGVEVELEIDPEKAGKVKVAIQVDEAGYLVEADTRYVEMFGYNVPIFRISPRSPLLAALARGQAARFIVEKKAVKIHLKGAAKAIATMRRACRG